MNEKYNKPKVSVLMPCYNHEKYVSYSIRSVLNQTYDNIELIVVDNGSTDGSYEIIESYRNEIDKIIHMDKNDVVKCGEILRREANGDYIACMTSDDYWDENKIKKQVEVLVSHPEMGACFTWAVKVDEEHKILQKLEEAGFDEKNHTREEWLEQLILGSNHICYPSALIKRESYFRAIEKQRLYYQLGDAFLWINILEKKEIFIIEEVLTYILWHPHGQNKNMSALSEKSIVRTNNEKADIVKYVVEGMDDDLFKRTFSKYFKNSKAQTHGEILCERLFFMMLIGEKKPEVAQMAISFYYQNNNKMNGSTIQEMLEEFYGYGYDEFQEYSGTHGCSACTIKQESINNIKWKEYIQNLYIQAMYGVIEDGTITETSVHTYRERIYLQLDKNIKEKIDIMYEYITNLFLVLGQCKDDNVVNCIYGIWENLKIIINIFSQSWDLWLQYDQGIKQEVWEKNMKILQDDEVDLEKFCDNTIPFLAQIQEILGGYKGIEK